MAATALVFLLIVFAITGGSDATWCVCRSDVSDTALQKTIDYACGTGADCSPIHKKGGCFEPDTVRAHCSYAANSYFQRKRQSNGTCDFSGTATLTNTDPSYSSCTYPSSLSTAGTSGTSSSNSFTPGNELVGFGPSGSLSTDSGEGRSEVLKRAFFLISLSFFFSMAIIVM